MALAMLMVAGASAVDDGAFDNGQSFGGDHRGDDHRDGGHFDRGHDWLNPGGSYSHTWWTPTYYEYSWYPTYAYSYYPTTYYYTTPVVYSTYYYDPVAYNYDPWWAANAYGIGGATYYSGSWSWSSHHGGFF